MLKDFLNDDLDGLNHVRREESADSGDGAEHFAAVLHERNPPQQRPRGEERNLHLRGDGPRRRGEVGREEREGRALVHAARPAAALARAPARRHDDDALKRARQATRRLLRATRRKLRLDARSVVRDLPVRLPELLLLPAARAARAGAPGAPPRLARHLDALQLDISLLKQLDRIRQPEHVLDDNHCVEEHLEKTRDALRVARRGRGIGAGIRAVGAALRWRRCEVLAQHRRGDAAEVLVLLHARAPVRAVPEAAADDLAPDVAQLLRIALQPPEQPHLLVPNAAQLDDSIARRRARRRGLQLRRRLAQRL